jgi:hypothetical protein
MTNFQNILNIWSLMVIWNLGFGHWHLIYEAVFKVGNNLYLNEED